MRNALFINLCVLLLTSCIKTEKKPSAKEINWFSGGMEKALLQAKSEKKPLFVYWGAQWCPPCNVVKSTIFKEPEVIAVTRKFLSVYLDGDTESAQQWGEKLNALGYPTLMVLDSEGTEVVRLDSTSSPKDFALALDSAYDNLYPMDEVIDKVLAQKPQEVDPKKWQLLANYSWSQDSHLAEKVDFAAAYEKLYRHIPDKYSTEKTQIFLNMLSARLQKLSDNPLTEKEKKEYLAIVEQVFTEENFSQFYKPFAYNGKDIVKAFYAENSEERKAFVDKYKSAIAKVREVLPLGSYERLITFYPLIELARLDDDKAALPEEERALIQKEMLASVEAIKDDHSQVFVSNSASYILQEAGFGDLARQTLKKDIEKSKTPYYSMASLAGLEKESGNKDEALKWIERAYNSAQGHATRLQWGSDYLLYLMDLSPDKDNEILLELQKYFAEHLKMSDAFMGRNKHRLNKIAGKIKEWGEKRKEKLQSMKNDWLARCEKASGTKTEYYRDACKKYFSELI